MTMENLKEIETVSIHTLGCRSNQYDSAAIEDMISSGGKRLVPFPGPADAYIINTCTVTARTDSESRRLVRKARRSNPESIIIVTGCYAQVSPDELSKVEGVDFIMGNPEKDKLLECLNPGRASAQESGKAGPAVEVSDYRAGTPLTLRAAGSGGGRTRANLKVQDGCDRRCSYCIIPMARGKSRSIEIDVVLGEIEDLIERGFKEFIFTGIHLGGWGLDLLPGRTFLDLLTEIEKKEYPARFRISSLDPDEVTDGLIELLSTAKTICNHLHLPLQSGDDTILRSMNRPYERAFFAERLEKLASNVPAISIGTDIIAGFPGEGEEEFMNTFSLLEALPVSYMHIFPYSRRSGTRAADFKDVVAPAGIKSRCKRLKELDIIKRNAFYASFLGETGKVLVESSRDSKTGLFKGRTRNYIPVLIEDCGDGGLIRDTGSTIKGQEVDVLLEEIAPEGVFGRLLSRDEE